MIENKISVVAFDRKLPIETDYVRVDNKAGSLLATKHLLDSGATRIACVNGDRSISTAMERLAGYVEAIEAAGLVAEPELQYFTDFKEEGGFQATLKILQMKKLPDAIFVTNNQMMSGVFHALRKNKIAVPEQISLVGFDDLPWVDIVTPPVTTMRQPTYDMGMTAVQKLISRFNGDLSGPEEIVFGAELVKRKSSIKKHNSVASK